MTSAEPTPREIAEQLVGPATQRHSEQLTVSAVVGGGIELRGESEQFVVRNIVVQWSRMDSDEPWRWRITLHGDDDARVFSDYGDTGAPEWALVFARVYRPVGAR